MPKIITTLNRIRAQHPCTEGWTKLLEHLGKTSADDEPLDLLTVLDSNGLDDTLWCFRAEPDYSSHYRLLAVSFAREVQHLMQDPSSSAARDVAEAYANGSATEEELEKARAAWDAAWAAWDAAWAARDAAWDAAWDAPDAAWAAPDSAWAARDAAWDAARNKQADMLREFLSAWR